MQKISFHRIPGILLFSILLLTKGFVQAQNPVSTSVQAPAYKIIIKGGHVIDPKNNINELMDIAIGQDNKIALVTKKIDPKLAVQVVNAKGMYVIPGLIDLHAHVFAGTELDHFYSNGSSAVAPDGFTFRAGVTTVVDCGGAGWKSFPTFKKNIIDQSRTRVLSFLNIVGEGMRGEDTWEQDINDMDSKKAAETALANKNDIVGFKLAHFRAPDWTPVMRAEEAGRLANMPIIVDFGGNYVDTPLSIETLFTKYFRPGDIYTHVYTELPQREPIVDLKTRQLKPFVLEAQKRGIIFDVGWGGASFDYRQAIPALKAGLYPNTMGTDLHRGSMLGPMFDQLHVLSTFLAMGMTLPNVIKAGTWAAAQAIKREELGNLSVGTVADIAVLSMRHGTFGFWDKMGAKIESKQKLECEVTIREGRIVYNLNGIATPIVVLNPVRR